MVLVTIIKLLIITAEALNNHHGSKNLMNNKISKNNDKDKLNVRLFDSFEKPPMSIGFAQ